MRSAQRRKRDLQVEICRPVCCARLIEAAYCCKYSDAKRLGSGLGTLGWRIDSVHSEGCALAAWHKTCGPSPTSWPGGGTFAGSSELW